MKILGYRVLVSKVEEPAAEGFSTVDVQDSFVYKGRIEILGSDLLHEGKHFRDEPIGLSVGDVIQFAKYSPDTQDIKHDGKDMKIVKFEDILAVI